MFFHKLRTRPCLCVDGILGLDNFRHHRRAGRMILGLAGEKWRDSGYAPSVKVASTNLGFATSTPSFLHPVQLGVYR